jgi:hypothetical protein
VEKQSSRQSCTPCTSLKYRFNEGGSSKTSSSNFEIDFKLLQTHGSVTQSKGVLKIASEVLKFVCRLTCAAVVTIEYIIFAPFGRLKVITYYARLQGQNPRRGAVAIASA